ncbi:hypothetical protein VB834_08270 [Limnoraphis robusta Tam1]|jgi:hypothetical protein|nr:hypothetical protein [Limnoraphis robusta]MEA5497124.1 hypothetical protein [Limnoraphis robusta BA-68 BA1]MEA5539026.1 hypothetical protein [Limnoraphis robusta Tam1]
MQEALMRKKAWYSEAFDFSSFGAFVNIPVRSTINPEFRLLEITLTQNNLNGAF